MRWRLWSSRSTVRLRLNLGYNPGSWVRCMNLLIKHRVRLLELRIEAEQSPSGIGPNPIEMTLRHPGRKQLDAVIAELNRASLRPSSDSGINWLSACVPRHRSKSPVTLGTSMAAVGFLEDQTIIRAILRADWQPLHLAHLLKLLGSLPSNALLSDEPLPTCIGSSLPGLRESDVQGIYSICKKVSG